ncbi:MAG: hypothetical protein Q4B40_01415 [Clostridia bacterium]|nr:hypothetical protein [Clostridia bacterium]
MKTTINKSAKRVLSLCLAFAMLLGSLFIANVGVNITADAETAKTNIVYWNGGTKEPTTQEDGVYIISTAEELAYLAQNGGSKSYKVADNIKAIVLQPQSLAGVMGLSAAQTKNFFEDSTNAALAQQWVTDSSKYFSGTLDFNGTTVYGMYITGSAKGGLFDTTTGNAEIKNVSIENTYINTSGRSGLATTWIGGNIALSGWSIKNNYINTTNNMSGVLVGQFSTSVLTISNIAIYDNEIIWQSSADKKIPLWRSSPATGSTLTNAILFDVAFNYNNISGASATSGSYTNVYTSHIGDPVPSGTDVITPINKGQLTGVAGMLYLTNEFNWGTDWFGIEGELPTPIKPANYVPLEMPEIWDPAVTANGFEGGDGTEENPYLIKTPSQLYKAVTDKSTRDDNKTPIYYKVADGVEELYLSGSNNWTANQLTNPFKGNFDGNGVKIIGMYSEGAQVGLFQYLGLGAVVKNITFDGCTANSSTNYAALLANKLTARTATVEGDGTLYTGVSGSTYGSVLVHNVAVINSSVTSSRIAAGLVAFEGVPDSIQFNNCLFDGVTTTLNASYKMGIYGTEVWNDNFEIHNSVSIGAYIAPNKQASDGRYYNDYSNYVNDAGTTMTVPTYIRNSYSINVDGTSLDISGCRTDSAVSFDSVKDNFHTNLPLLDWATGWTTATVGGREIPMPTVRTAADKLGDGDQGRAALDWGTYLGTFGDSGASYQGGSYVDGTYGHFNQFEGWGTYEAPYIIYDALDLARAIGCGALNYGTPIYFMLANDIDLSGFLWLTTAEFKYIATGYTGYKYIPFEGTLNGNGHTITGLYVTASYKETAESEDLKGLAGLIPMLNGGIVKLLNMRHCHTGAETNGNIGNAGVMFGSSKNASVVEQSSVEDCCAIGTTDLKGAGVLTLKNSYYIDSQTGNSQYFDDDGNVISDFSTFDYEKVWYKGGLEGDTPKLLTRAKVMPYTDVDGDGDGYSYSSNDLVALRNKLMRKASYANVYGDVNNNGETNVLDLVILKREMIDDYNHKDDRFWRAAELGNIDIFYGENDNYDAARNMQVYFKMRYGVDVNKHIVLASGDTTTVTHPGDNTGVTPATNAENHFDVIIGDIPAANYVSEWTNNSTDDYKVWSDHDSATLWLQGESTTSVEQAVSDWTADSYARSMTSEVKEGAVIGETAIPAYKNSINIDGKDYYYVWGDEFGKLDGSTEALTENPDTLNRGHWINTVAHSGGATEADNIKSDKKDLRSGAAPAIEALTEVRDGKLIIKRGYLKGSTISGAVQNADVSANGMVGLTEKQAISATNTGSNDRFYTAGSFSTDNMMLFKQGYIEFRAAIPAEGHAFPALWLHSMGNANIKSNASWSESLYGKIFKLNNAQNGVAYPWNGQDKIVFPTTADDLATFKYQIPSIAYEIDIFELMQTTANINRSPEGDYGYPEETKKARDWRTAVGWYFDKPTMHRWYRNGINDDGTFYVRDFVNGTISDAVNSSPSSTSIATTDIDFGTEMESARDHLYGSNIKVYTGNPNSETNKAAYAEMTKMRRYGFLWYADKNGTFNFKVFVYDINGETVTKNLTVNTTLGTEVTEDDAKRMAEMYMYILIDNEFYTHNDFDDGYAPKTDVTNYEYTDLLTAGGANATHMEIDYVRVYQLDGKRDIVTAETEAFNNGNHFGY